MFNLNNLRQEAIQMLATEDLSGWSAKHDQVTIEALREAIKVEEANRKPEGWIPTGM